MLVKLGMKECWYPKILRMLQTSFTDLRLHGQSRRPLALSGSILIWFSLMMTPRYETVGYSNLHLESLRKYDSSSSKLSQHVMMYIFLFLSSFYLSCVLL